jgi:hypothetical protein
MSYEKKTCKTNHNEKRSHCFVKETRIDVRSFFENEHIPPCALCCPDLYTHVKKKHNIKSEQSNREFFICIDTWYSMHYVMWILCLHNRIFIAKQEKTSRDRSRAHFK